MTWELRASRWFEGAPLGYSTSVEGSNVIGGRVILGLRAGGEVDPFNLIHEIAHFVEIDDARCALPNWGLRLRKTCVPGFPDFEEPLTFQAPAREIRVAGIQRVLSRDFGVAFDVDFFASLIWDWVPGVCHIDAAFSGLPARSSHEEREKACRERISRAIREESKKWTLRQVKREWDRKCVLLKRNKPPEGR